MDGRGKIKTLIRPQRRKLRDRVGNLYAVTLESKVARSFTDDIGLRRGLGLERCSQYRPGQRDDGRCALGALQTI